ncbi:MAG: AraC family transcriptional regulator [Flavihumibacter sp.]|nr:AraC family transcriptional regulator [Flavihumibacter sp.]
MKARLLERFIDINRSVSVQHYSSSYFLNVLHYHPEYELDIIKKGTGIRFIGDSIERFEPGDIVLMGKDLPHLWQNDAAYFEKNTSLKAEAVVIHFGINLETAIQAMPELNSITKMLDRSSLGISFPASSNKKIAEKIEKLDKLPGHLQVIALIEILSSLCNDSKYKVLSSPGFLNTIKDVHVARMEPVYHYVMKNFKQDIPLEKVAELANMNPSSFSRYFSSYHKKTFTKFLNQIRIGYACKLLIENDHTIGSICYESGFNNISNFNRIFREIKNMTPSEFMNLHSPKASYQ